MDRSPYGCRRGSVRLSFVALVTSNADDSFYDFGNFVVPADGLLIVGALGRNTNGANITVASVSIDGSAAPMFVNPAGSSTPVAIAALPVLAGNRNVSISLSGGVLRAAAAAWLMTNYSSALPFDVDGTNSGNVTSASATLDVAKGGATVFMHMHNNDAGSYSTASNSVAPSTIEGGSIIQPGHLLPTASVAGHVETVSWGGASRASGIAAASWR